MIELTRNRAEQIAKRMRERRVVVYGDCMLDEFVWGEVTRISPEAPVPVVDVRNESARLGGAANVFANLRALGVGRASVIGVVGDDTAGKRLLTLLQEAGVGRASEELITDETRPTTSKTRIIAHNQLVVRADRERRTPVDGATERAITDVLKRALQTADALVVSDYDKGAVTPQVLTEILPLAHERGVPVLIDPKARNFDYYRPATLVTPNHHEALRLTNKEEASDEAVAEAAREIKRRLNCQAVLVTRGERGMLLMETDETPVFIKTTAREIYDVTGAGDTVIATLAAALAAGATLTEAAVLANRAAGIVVGKLGTATVSFGELVDSITAD
ncbi:MAG: D-glycero-beta-D-manno-heptose-7-phosphate kinase [Pyrinomonadaceae bacterium]|nr:D-glycero-beta-D-manno-heptose-7-phosphate kinase [Pyrinomonadaceae bacterium]